MSRRVPRASAAVFVTTARVIGARVIGALVFGALLVGACSSVGTPSTTTAPAPWWRGVAVTDMRGKATGTPPSVHVQVADNTFTPSVLRIDAGVTVVWSDSGATTHNILQALPTQDFGAQFGTDAIANGQQYSFAFTKPGVYRYYCSLHGSATAGMVGMVVVGDAPIPTSY